MERGNLVLSRRRNESVEIGNATIAAIRKGEASEDGVAFLVANVTASLKPFQTYLDGLESRMVEMVKTLPIAAWCDEPEQRGFGLKSLARIVGEAGDLSTYANPGKLWKRMGCAPYEGHMPSSWRSGKHGKLSAEQWESIGYSPHRRSVMYPMSESLLKLNHGPYRQRYDAKKAEFLQRHPDASDGHCHNHAMLLVAKELLKRLWKQWRGET